MTSDQPHGDPFRQRIWHLAGGRTLELGAVSRIMGVLNVTPDSFSDGGLFVSVEDAVAQAKTLIADGADIIDIGGESTRPGAEAVDGETERKRILPIIKAITQACDCLISVDTYRAETANAALEQGAHIVNDVWGVQREPDIVQVAQKAGAGLVIMHTGRERETLSDVIEDQNHFLRKSIELTEKYSFPFNQICLDPGFGFAKNTEENIQLLARLNELHHFDLPLLIGTSRKRFLGAVSGQENADHRDGITAASGVIARMAGAQIFRVHNVRAQKEALALADVVLSHRPPAS